METSPETILKELLEAAGIEYRGVSKSDVAGQTIYAIDVDDARPVVGSRGETIQAIDYLVKKISEQKNPPAEDRRDGMFLIDVNGFRTRQIKDLQSKALMMAERARSFQYDVELSPMSAYERLIVHTTLQDAPNVKTESQGEGRGRRVVIKYSAE